MFKNWHLNIRIVWIFKISLTPPLLIEVPIPSRESECSCICVLMGIDFPYIYNFIGFWELVQQCGIFCFSIRFWELVQQCDIFCFSIRFWELVQQCGILRTGPTVWYILFFMLFLIKRNAIFAILYILHLYWNSEYFIFNITWFNMHVQLVVYLICCRIRSIVLSFIRLSAN